MSLCLTTQKGNYGNTLVMTCKTSSGTVVDVSDFITILIDFTDNKGSIFTRTGEFTTDGTDGKVQYTFVEGDLTTYGSWSAQAILSKDGSTERTSILDFTVGKNIR